ncbi:uncharacterized protein J3R85_020589 [Psidium guajava]|nr:uncharacterized protein J3R85_020589 [Psidium guajava]
MALIEFVHYFEISRLLIFFAGKEGYFVEFPGEVRDYRFL